MGKLCFSIVFMCSCGVIEEHWTCNQIKAINLNEALKFFESFIFSVMCERIKKYPVICFDLASSLISKEIL